MYLCEIHSPVDITPSSLLSLIYNLIGGHLFGTKFIPIKRFTPKVSQWTGLYLKQTQADYAIIIHPYPFSL